MALRSAERGVGRCHRQGRNPSQVSASPAPGAAEADPSSPPRSGRVPAGARARTACWEGARAAAILSYRLLFRGGFSACERAKGLGDSVAGVFFGGCQGRWEQPPEKSTMISAAQLLDELMGRDRNLAPDEKRSNVRWDHESVSPAGLGSVPGRRGGGERRRLGPVRLSARFGARAARGRVSDPVAGGRSPPGSGDEE